MELPQNQDNENVSLSGTEGTSESVGNDSAGEGSTSNAASEGLRAGEAAGDAADAGNSTNAYTPDYKYKVADQEKELEEWARQYIKDPETEKKFKDLYTRVDAFEFQKTKRERAEQEREQFKTEHQKLAGWVQGMMQLRDSGDYDEFFSKVRLDEEKVMKWMLNKLETQEKLRDLPPEMRQQYNEQQELKRKARELEESNYAMQEQYRQQLVAVRANELDRTLASPEISTLVAQYDQAAGAPGAFRKLVIRHGNAEFLESQGERDLSPQEAVNEVMKLLRLQNATQGAGQAPKPNGLAATGAKVVPTPNTASLPNLGAGGASSATGKGKPKSIDDLRKLAKQMQAAAE